MIQTILLVLGFLEVAGLIVAIILCIPLVIVADEGTEIEVERIKSLQMWFLVLPLTIVIWSFKFVRRLIQIYSNNY